MLQLKNIKINKAMSQETYAYSADLYFNGKLVGQVGNRGRGGGDDWHGPQAKFQEADAWCRANNDPLKIDDHSDPLEMCLELWCAKRCEEHLMLQDYQRVMRTNVVFVRNGGNVFTMPLKGHKLAVVSQLVTEQYRDAVVLNGFQPENILLAIDAKKKAAQVAA